MYQWNDKRQTAAWREKPRKTGVQYCRHWASRARRWTTERKEMAQPSTPFVSPCWLLFGRRRTPKAGVNLRCFYNLQRPSCHSSELNSKNGNESNDKGVVITKANNKTPASTTYEHELNPRINRLLSRGDHVARTLLANSQNWFPISQFTINIDI